jgi:hypothetical protein
MMGARRADAMQVEPRSLGSQVWSAYMLHSKVGTTSMHNLKTMRVVIDTRSRGLHVLLRAGGQHGAAPGSCRGAHPGGS